jgi:transmembrane sensor
MEKKMEIEKLIRKFNLGIITDDELIILLNNVQEKEPGPELLEHYQKEWEKSDGFNAETNSKDIYNKIVSKVGVRLEPVTGSPEKVYFRRLRLIMRYAAVFVLAFGLSWLVHSLYFNETTSSFVAEQIQSVEVPYGSKSRIALPDGSVVTLNSGSSLKYSSSDFNNESRSVSFTGEGFFDVSSDSSKPFYVTTPGIKVKVLGTVFNLKAYPDENIEETTLISGRVEIYSSSDKNEEGKPIVLIPNQSAVFVKSEDTKPTIAHKDVDRLDIVPVKLRKIELQPLATTEQTISWKDNTLMFDNEPFSSLAVRLERWYDVKIVVNNPELNSARFTGKFDKETVEQVLKALSTVTHFNYDIKQNKISITKNRPL